MRQLVRWADLGPPGSLCLKLGSFGFDGALPAPSSPRPPHRLGAGQRDGALALLLLSGVNRMWLLGAAALLGMARALG